MVGEADTRYTSAEDRRALEQILYKRYIGFVKAILRSELRNSALVPDLAHDVFVIAISALRSRKIRKTGCIKAYLVSTARFAAWNANRAYCNKTESLDCADLYPSSTREPIDALVSEEARGLAQFALDSLTQERDRSLLQRRYLVDEDKTLTCTALGIPNRNYHKAIHNARRRARKLVTCDTSSKHKQVYASAMPSAAPIDDFFESASVNAT